jgi:hypothetical protein
LVTEIMKEIFTTVSVRHDEQSGIVSITLCQSENGVKKRGKPTREFQATIPPSMMGDSSVATGMRRMFLRQMAARVGNAILNGSFPEDCPPDLIPSPAPVGPPPTTKAKP